METAVRQISNRQGGIYLFDLYNDDGTFQYEPCLVFENAGHENCLDNTDWLLIFFRGLKKNKKTAKKELKTFCKDNNLDFEETSDTLLSIYKTSKKLNFWKS